MKTHPSILTEECITNSKCYTSDQTSLIEIIIQESLSSNDLQKSQM